MPEEIQVKLLDRDEADLLSQVAPEVFDDPIDPPVARAFLDDDRHHLAVAVEAGRIVGFVSAVLYLHPDKPRPELWINEVGVAPTHQGRGLGKAMLKLILQSGRQRDCAEAWVLTDRDNSRAMGLYQSCDGREAPRDQVMFTYFLDD